MKSYTLVILSLVLLSLYTPMQAQFGQPNGLRDRQITHLPNVGTNVSQGISREYLGAPSKHRLQTGFMARIDSLQMKGSSYPFPNERFIPKGLQKGSNPALAKMFPQSRISVIDTAIVRSTVDTTRHVYSFTAKAKMTSDVTQKLTGDLWVNVRRTSYTYDANSNMLSELYDVWSNGQWVNSDRFTYTYDAQGNLNSLWHYGWLNSSWIPRDIGGKTFGEYFFVFESAGNDYVFGRGYNLNFTRTVIITGVPSENGNVPPVYSLSQNYPNPFNPSTTIRFLVSTSTQVTLKVFDIVGREVATLVNERLQAGSYETTFNANVVASGMYLYRLQAGDFVQTKKMLVVK